MIKQISLTQESQKKNNHSFLPITGLLGDITKIHIFHFFLSQHFDRLSSDFSSTASFSVSKSGTLFLNAKKISRDLLCSSFVDFLLLKPKRWVRIGGLQQWIKMAQASGIKELSHFAEKKDKKRDEILNHAKMPISSGVIEGCMNKIKVIKRKRTAFGFRDFDYFFDRIWYAFLPWQNKIEARNKVWECYELNFPELLGETIEQQKIG